MTTLTIIIVYLVGVVLSYLFNRWIYSDIWTIRLRTKHLLLSLFSWIQIFFMLIAALMKAIEEGSKNEDKAKW